MDRKLFSYMIRGQMEGISYEENLLLLEESSTTLSHLPADDAAFQYFHNETYRLFRYPHSLALDQRVAKTYAYTFVELTQEGAATDSVVSDIRTAAELIGADLWVAKKSNKIILYLQGRETPGKSQEEVLKPFLSLFSPARSRMGSVMQPERIGDIMTCAWGEIGGKPISLDLSVHDVWQVYRTYPYQLCTKEFSWT